MARPHIEPFVETNEDFKSMTLGGFPPGMKYKILSFDTETGACSMKVQFDGGFALKPGFSFSEIEMFVLKGSLTFGKDKYGPGTYFCIPAGVSMPSLKTSRGAQALMMYNSCEPNFTESDQDHERANRAGLAIVDAYEGMPWAMSSRSPGVATGCLVKILKVDPRTLATTFMYCMTPNFMQDNISYHDCSEESYHIWGTSWMMQFGELPTAGYFWRPPYINHGAFASKQGTIALGRTDAELYNHFHFNPWTNPDENQERAASRLHHRNPALYKWVMMRDHNHPHPHDFDFAADTDEPSGLEPHV